MSDTGKPTESLVPDEQQAPPQVPQLGRTDVALLDYDIPPLEEDFHDPTRPIKRHKFFSALQMVDLSDTNDQCWLRHEHLLPPLFETESRLMICAQACAYMTTWLLFSLFIDMKRYYERNVDRGLLIVGACRRSTRVLRQKVDAIINACPQSTRPRTVVSVPIGKFVSFARGLGSRVHDTRWFVYVDDFVPQKRQTISTMLCHLRDLTCVKCIRVHSFPIADAGYTLFGFHRIDVPLE